MDVLVTGGTGRLGQRLLGPLQGAGHTVRQTARSLGIAEKTVENTQARLFRKLGAHNRAGALAAAHGWGLIEAEGADRPRNGRTPWPQHGRTLAEP